jgi:hypothetical protein
VSPHHRAHASGSALGCRGKKKGPSQERGLGGHTGRSAVLVLAETISENDPASPRYKAAGLRVDIRKHGGSIAVTDSRPAFSCPPTACHGGIGHGLARTSREVESTFKELCRGLSAHDLSHATQKCSADVLCDVR